MCRAKLLSYPAVTCPIEALQSKTQWLSNSKKPSSKSRMFRSLLHRTHPKKKETIRSLRRPPHARSRSTPPHSWARVSLRRTSGHRVPIIRRKTLFQFKDRESIYSWTEGRLIRTRALWWAKIRPCPSDTPRWRAESTAVECTRIGRHWSRTWRMWWVLRIASLGPLVMGGTPTTMLGIGSVTSLSRKSSIGQPNSNAQRANLMNNSHTLDELSSINQYQDMALT